MSAPGIVEVLHTSGNRTTAETVTSDDVAGGDTLILVYGSDFFSLSNMPDPTSTAGTPLQIGFMDNGDNGVHAKVYLFVAESDGPHDFTFPAHNGCDIYGTVLRTPAAAQLEDIVATQGSLAGVTNLVAPSRASQGTDRLLVCVWMAQDIGSFTGSAFVLPGSMTERAQIGSSPFSAMGVATEALPIQGDSGTRIATSQLTKYRAMSFLLTAPEEPEPEPEPTPEQTNRGWYGLMSIYDEAASLWRDDRTRVPTACPNDGEPLEPGPRGTLFCKFDGWEYPRDWDAGYG